MHDDAWLPGLLLLKVAEALTTTPLPLLLPLPFHFLLTTCIWTLIAFGLRWSHNITHPGMKLQLRRLIIGSTYSTSHGALLALAWACGRVDHHCSTAHHVKESMVAPDPPGPCM